VETPADAVIVSLDRASAQRLRLPPDPRYWPRAGRARLIDRLGEAGASAIVLDTFLERETDPANDAALAESIARSGRVVLLTRLVPADMLPLENNAGIAAHALPAVGQADPIPRFSVARALAPFPLPKDEGRLIRVWVFISDLGDRPTLPAVAAQIHLMPALRSWQRILTECGAPPDAVPPADARALEVPGALARSMRSLRRAFLQDAGLAVRLRDALETGSTRWSPNEHDSIKALIRLYDGPDSRYLNFYGPPGRIRIVPYADLVAPGPDEPLPDLADKVVFVGNADPSAVYNADRHVTVFSTEDGRDISGVEIGATAFVNMLQGTDLLQLAPWTGIATLLASGLAFGLAAYLLPVPAAIFAAFALGCAYFVGAYLVFTGYNLWPPVALPLLLQMPAALVTGLLWQQRNISQSLRKYLPPRVAKTLRTCPIDLHMIDRSIYGVCLATDVQGYTTLSEALAPTELASLTNDYFDTIFEPVIRRNGMVTGIAGDGVMSVWSSNTPDTEMCGQAALAALDILRRVDSFNERKASRAMPTRFGLSAGKMVLGNIGGAGHFSYNAVGDVPNTASRLEGLNKHLGTRILATDEIVTDIRHLLTRRIGKFRLMGKMDPVTIHEILCPLPSSQAQDRMRCAAYEKALAVFEKGRWEEAEQRFSALTATYPGDGPARYMQDQCRQRLSAGHGEADTVIRLASK